MAQGTLIEHVPKNTEGKYGHGKGVAAQARVAIEEPGEYLVVVFWSNGMTFSQHTVRRDASGRSGYLDARSCSKIWD